MQGENKNIVVHLAVMDGVFVRLLKPLEEADKLEIVLHNVRSRLTM